MANRIKRKLIQQISARLGDTGTRLSSIKSIRKPNEFAMRLSTNDLDLVESVNSIHNDLDGIEKLETKMAGAYRNVKFLVAPDYLIQEVVGECLDPSVEREVRARKLIFEFSSPNIAKPFHVGHLRSTILGNYLANLNTHFNEKVTRINYLGDWGTQFGMLKVGVDLCKISEDAIRNDPLGSLYAAYVRANQIASQNNEINIKARQTFNELEKGDESLRKEWNLYKDLTLDDMITTYDRLNVRFDEYDWESMYNSTVVNHIMADLERKGVVRTDPDGKKVVNIEGEDTIIMKSDGSSLYLSRDVAAAHDRFAKFNFDEMFYVVDNSQAGHFKSLFSVLQQMESPIADKCRHIRFGRVRGMSTRKGTTVFLKDILDEAKLRMQQLRQAKTTTRGDMDDETISEILGTTALIVYDLKRKRTRDYDFSWDQALSHIQQSGARLQYTHCRLCSLEEKCEMEIPTNCNPALLRNPEMLQLAQRLAYFNDVLLESRREHEPYVLVHYLFNLCHEINRALEKLRVKGEEHKVAEQRLLMYHCARLTLKRGMELLGVRPLTEM